MAPRPGGRSSINAADTAEAASRPISGKASILLSDEEKVGGGLFCSLKPRPGYTKVIETDMVQVVEKLDDNDMIALSAYAGPEAQKASDQVR
jgi:hypothetical protein